MTPPMPPIAPRIGWMWLALLGCQLGQAQPATRDSLTSLLAQATSDTGSIRLLIELSVAWYYHHPDSALSYAEQGLARSRAIDFEEGMARGLNAKGNAFRKLGQTDSALHAYLAALEIRHRQQQPLRIAATFNNLGQLYRKMGQPDKAMAHYQQGIELVKDLPPSQEYSNLCNSLGVLLKQQEAWQEAQVWLERAADIARARGDAGRLASAMSNLGTLAAQQGDFATAMKHFQQAQAGYESSDNATGVSRTFRNMGNVLLEQGLLEQAEPLYLQSLEWESKTADPEAMAHAYLSIGVLFSEYAEYETALLFFQRALNQIDSLQYPELHKHLLLNLAKTFEELGQSEQASEHLQQYLQLQEALVARERRSDSLYQYLQLTEAERQTAQANNRLLLASLVLLVLIGLGTALALAHRHRHRQLAQELGEVLRNQELLQLGAMLKGQEKAQSLLAKELHDNIGMLLSAVNLQLSGIGEKLDTQQARFQQAQTTLQQAVKEVRALSHQMLSGTMQHLGLVEALHDLIQILHQSGQLHIHLETHGMEAPRLPHSSSHAVYRIMQELFSNVIRHAQATEVQLQLTQHRDVLNIHFQDNGKGFDPKRLDKESGVGLRNIRGRVQDLGGHFHLDSQPGKGTTVILDIPLIDPQQAWHHA